jgi:hypothetical protein
MFVCGARGSAKATSKGACDASPFVKVVAIAVAGMKDDGGIERGGRQNRGVNSRGIAALGAMSDLECLLCCHHPTLTSFNQSNLSSHIARAEPSPPED